MTISPFDSQLFGQLLSDDELIPLFSDLAFVRYILHFEIALAKAEAKAGIIPKDAPEQMARGLSYFSPNLEDLSTGASNDGVPVPALIDLARQHLGDELGQYIHWGATSQDAIDTALILRINQALELLERRLSNVQNELLNLAVEYADTVMAGRTRYQQAIPTTFGYKVRGWAEPLTRHLERLKELKPRLLVLSFGGAVGTLAALGDSANEVSENLAAELCLSLPPVAWHTHRDNIAEFANWLSLLTGSLGKIGQDLALLAQSEVAEIELTSGGGSSTIPLKSNPISAEVLITLARFNAGQLSAIHQAVIQENERGGPGWTLEWMVLPQMIAAAGTALKKTQLIVGELEVQPLRMKENLERSNGLSLSEAAVFKLAEHVNKLKAHQIVKSAAQEAVETSANLIDVLARQTQYPIDWNDLKIYENYTGLAAERAGKIKK